VSQRDPAQTLTQVGRMERSEDHIAEETEDCILVNTRMFDVTGAVEPEQVEGPAVDEMGSSDRLSLQNGAGYIEMVDDADQLTTKCALNECGVVQESTPKNPATETTRRASTYGVDTIARYDDLSQRPEDYPKPINWQCLLQPSWIGTAPHGTELQTLRLEQVHPPSQDSTCSQTDVADLPAVSNLASVSAPQYQQFLPPLLPPFLTAPSSELVIPRQPYKSHSVTFTIENEIRSALSPTETELLFQIFSRNARLLVRSKESPTEGILYPVEALMRQTSTDFYKWYTVESKAAARISVLRFLLPDCHWYDGGAVLIPGWNLSYFRLLKQTIWDSFWLRFSLNCAPTLFRIFVSHLPGNVLDYSAVGPAFETTAAFAVTDVGSPIMIASPRKEISVETYIGAPTTANESGVSSIFQDPRPPYAGRKSNIYHLLNPFNVDI
jgi:hypothetical protein